MCDTYPPGITLFSFPGAEISAAGLGKVNEVSSANSLFGGSENEDGSAEPRVEVRGSDDAVEEGGGHEGDGGGPGEHSDHSAERIPDRGKEGCGAHLGHGGTSRDDANYGSCANERSGGNEGNDSNNKDDPDDGWEDVVDIDASVHSPTLRTTNEAITESDPSLDPFVGGPKKNQKGKERPIEESESEQDAQKARKKARQDQAAKRKADDPAPDKIRCAHIKPAKGIKAAEQCRNTFNPQEDRSVYCHRHRHLYPGGGGGGEGEPAA